MAPDPSFHNESVEGARGGSYLFCTGSAWFWGTYQNQTGTNHKLNGVAGRASRGAFGNNGAASIAEITDGTSNTVLVGEAKVQFNDNNCDPNRLREYNFH